MEAALSTAQSAEFTRWLAAWYRENARVLPWRGIQNPYRTWVSEIMLQQTRVEAVKDHYARFLARFPTVLSLALAPESDVLALWSGLGYYRRARMLHKAAQLLVEGYGGSLPQTALELKRLPGVGSYTAAAIASIAFGERIAVVDGNVERVLLRVLGMPETRGSAAAELLERTAQQLVPEKNPGDHNQAMMELGATVCLPRGPRCDACPVYKLCQTRGEHVTAPRAKMRSERISAGLSTRKARGGVALEVLLQRRPADAQRMAGMLELPELTGGDDSGELMLLPEPVLRVRHAIVGTNYYVEIYPFATKRDIVKRVQRQDGMEWVRTSALAGQPLTGLARKVLQRLKLMKTEAVVDQDVPLMIGRGGRAATGNEA